MNLYPWQEKAWLELNKSASKLHHAYLLIGPLGAGLERFANVFASSLICKNLTDSMQACGKCQDCKWLSTEHPNLTEGKVVISDRFTDATYAYQSGGKGVKEKKIDILKEWVQASLQPDLTFLFEDRKSVV